MACRSSIARRLGRQIQAPQTPAGRRRPVTGHPRRRNYYAPGRRSPTLPKGRGHGHACSGSRRWTCVCRTPTDRRHHRITRHQGRNRQWSLPSHAHAPHSGETTARVSKPSGSAGPALRAQHPTSTSTWDALWSTWRRTRSRATRQRRRSNCGGHPNGRGAPGRALGAGGVAGEKRLKFVRSCVRSMAKSVKCARQQSNWPSKRGVLQRNGWQQQLMRVMWLTKRL
jgi:hypothetical protein